MSRATFRWLLFFGGLLVVGPLAWLCTSRGLAFDAVTPATPILSGSGPVVGLLLGVIALALAGGYGAAVAWYTTPRWGLFNAGVVAVWAAAGTGRIDDLIRVHNPGTGMAPLGALAVEGAVLGAVAVGVGLGLHLIALRRRQIPTITDRREEHAAREAGEFALIAAVGVIMAGVVSFVVIQNTLKGQTIAAGALAGLLAATLGTFISERWGRAGLAYIAGFALVAFLAPLVAVFVERGGTALIRSANGVNLFAPARALPLDWIAGGLLGIPLGLAWGQSLHASPAPEQPGTATT
jgi:hypothetical protein